MKRAISVKPDAQIRILVIFIYFLVQVSFFTLGIMEMHNENENSIKSETSDIIILANELKAKAHFE